MQPQHLPGWLYCLHFSTCRSEEMFLWEFSSSRQGAQSGMQLALKAEVQGKMPLHVLWFCWPPACTSRFLCCLANLISLLQALSSHWKCSLSRLTTAFPPTRPSTALASRGNFQTDPANTFLFPLTSNCLFRNMF